MNSISPAELLRSGDILFILREVTTVVYLLSALPRYNRESSVQKTLKDDFL